MWNTGGHTHLSGSAGQRHSPPSRLAVHTSQQEFKVLRSCRATATQEDTLTLSKKKNPKNTQKLCDLLGGESLSTGSLATPPHHDRWADELNLLQAPLNDLLEFILNIQDS